MDQAPIDPLVGALQDLAVVVSGDQPHPTRELGLEYAHEVGCSVCLRVGTRPGWERQGWHCPFSCGGGPEDVITGVEAMRRRGGPGVRQELHHNRTGRRHGTVSAYVHGCRCDDCRLAHGEYQRERRRKRAFEKMQEELGQSG